MEGGPSDGRLREISDRLAAIARELEGEVAGDERAAELAREAAELSSEAVAEANRRIREAEADSG
jgi:regulator of protease activity HflC (stomatin/prohibitin superfamily)